MAIDQTIARDELVQPLDGDNPVGEDLRYEGPYDELDEARREDEALPEGDWEREGKRAEWDRVIQIASSPAPASAVMTPMVAGHPGWARLLRHSMSTVENHQMPRAKRIGAR